LPSPEISGEEHSINQTSINQTKVLSVNIFFIQLKFTCGNEMSGSLTAHIMQLISEELHYPRVQKQAKKEGAIIYFAYFSNDIANYPVKPSANVANASNLKPKLISITAESAQGLLRFMALKSKISAVKFIGFLQRLVDSETKPIVLIVGYHQLVSHKKIVSFVDSMEGKLKIWMVGYMYADN
jgi:hypothetical protein